MTTQSKTKKLQPPTAAQLAKITSAIRKELELVHTPYAHIIAITNQKGGVGKTSTAFNFAHYLNELGYRVLVIDLDGQGNLTELFFGASVLSTYIHTSALELFSEGASDSFHPLNHPSGIDVVATQSNCHELNAVDTQDIGIAQVYAQNLESISAQYDFVVCDTPPAPGVRTTVACATAEYIFAPVLVDTFAESALQGVISSIQNIGALLGTDIPLTGIVINQVVRDGTPESLKQYETLANKIGDLLIPTSIRYSKPFRRAQREGVPVWHLHRSGAERETSNETRQAYGEMAARIPAISKLRNENFKEVSRQVRAKVVARLTGV